MSYTEVAVSGYNSNPPPDDGSTGSANQVYWSKIKTKLFDPIRDAHQTIDDNVNSAVASADNSISSMETSVSTLSANIATIATTMRGPDGTAMLFRQTTPPTGWTKGTDLDDYALRLVTGTASTGGSSAFTSVFTSRTITTAMLPSHTHSFSDSSRAASFTGTTSFIYDLNDSNASASAGGVTCANSINNNNSTYTATYDFPGATTGGGTGSGTAWSFAIQYVDTIYATKD